MGSYCKWFAKSRGRDAFFRVRHFVCRIADAVERVFTPRFIGSRHADFGENWVASKRRLALTAFGLSAGILLLEMIAVAAYAAEPRKLRVLTSIPPLYCFAINVAANVASVENLLPGDVEPHEYQLSTKDVQRIRRADLILVNGLGLESWLERPLRENRAAKTLVAEVAAGLPSEAVIPMSLSGSAPNPHIWLDPILAAHCVTNIALAMQRADPDHRARYVTNAQRYCDRLAVLDREIRKLLAPARSRPFVTYHNAFPYFVRRYELNLIGVLEQVPDAEPGPKDLHRLLQTMRREKVKVVFTEPQFPSRLVRQISRDLSLTTAELDPMETGKFAEDSYEETMRNNARVLRTTLGGLENSSQAQANAFEIVRTNALPRAAPRR